MRLSEQKWTNFSPKGVAKTRCGLLSSRVGLRFRGKFRGLRFRCLGFRFSLRLKKTPQGSMYLYSIYLGQKGLKYRCFEA